MAVTSEQLLRFASTLENVEISTLAGRAKFTVQVLPGGIEITPRSSGKSRLVNREMVQRVCNEYERSRSTSPGHYQSITFDASYLLALINRYQQTA